MTRKRQAELLLAEAQRRRSIAMVDEPRRLEHLEVAEALELAAARIRRKRRGLRCKK